MTRKAPDRINKSLTIIDRNIMTFATKKGSQRYSKQKNMLTPELHISDNFTTADRISSETLWTYCAELKKTKAVIFALCMRGRIKAMINLVQYNIGPGTMIAIPRKVSYKCRRHRTMCRCMRYSFHLHSFTKPTWTDRSSIRSTSSTNTPCSHCPREFSASTSRLSRF